MKYPNIMNVNSVVEQAQEVSTEIDGEWVPCRPIGFQSLYYRCWAAWLVLTGKADALLWHKQ